VQRTARPTVTFPDYYSATRELVLTLLQSGDHPIYLDLLSGIGGDAVSHATAVSQLALTLGIRLEQYLINQRKRLPPKHAREVVNLGVAAMLHDIGKSRLPPELQSRSGIDVPEDPSQRAEWESHVTIGADLLRHGIEPSAVAAVAHHHQHFDGSGFPSWQRQGILGRPPQGTEIHVFARILLVADMYDRLTLTEHGRRWPVEILHLLRTRYSAWIDPVILQMLPKVVPPFPPGSRVTLSDGSRGIVIKSDPDNPYWPVVRRMVDDKMKLAEEVTRTGKDTGLAIRELSGVNVEKFVPAPEKAAA
jgi:HD-GYP domain-containing protein (c-di-GMP phosphodiesterase class II)